MDFGSKTPKTPNPGFSGVNGGALWEFLSLWPSIVIIYDLIHILSIFGGGKGFSSNYDRELGMWRVRARVAAIGALGRPIKRPVGPFDRTPFAPLRSLIELKVRPFGLRDPAGPSAYWSTGGNRLVSTQGRHQRDTWSGVWRPGENFKIFS